MLLVDGAAVAGVGLHVDTTAYVFLVLNCDVLEITGVATLGQNIYWSNIWTACNINSYKNFGKNLQALFTTVETTLWIITILVGL